MDKAGFIKKHLDILKIVGLFNGIDSKELEVMLKCIGAEIKNVKKGEIILLAGDTPKHIGVLLSGKLHIMREDYDGNRFIMTSITPGEIFGEALCCAGVSESPVTVIADFDSIIMPLSFSRILNTCPNSCSYHTKMIENMLGLIAKKNLLLQSRMEIIGVKPTRARIMRYFESFIQKHGKKFLVPFNREEMANFLGVERSALSHELARMKKEGLIEYKKNEFILLRQ